jgi:S1-C subfamily serine protease
MTNSPQPNTILQALSDSLAGAVEIVTPSLVSVHARHRQSSTGVIWHDGVVVTAEHTVERDDDINVVLADGTKKSATLAGRDATTDIAVFRVDGTSSVATLADISTVRVGGFALALGYTDENGTQASFGTISTVSDGWRTHQGGQIDKLIRADITMYPGFSGGPLVDVSGRVIGINTSRLSRAFPITIPASTVNSVVEQLLSKGHIERGYLGVYMQPVRIPDALASNLNITANTGLIIVSVEQGGPAEQAGILIGDILIAIEGTTISDTNDVQSLLGSDRVGKAVSVQLIRGGALQTLPVTVGVRPQKGH